ncbi:MAG TPA: hypothetical protein VND67_03090 [Acidimicrobiales bacterium]|nr:hypothetical protein [Acidimicrobiales bacterium]
MPVGLEDPAQAADAEDAARTGTDAGAGLAPRRTSVAMAVLMSILFLTFLDNTVISASLSDIQSGLHAGVTQLLALTASGAMLLASAVVGFFTARSARRRRAGGDAHSPVVAAGPG